MTDPLPACWSCGSERVGPTNDLITCGDCGAGPEPEHIWRTRALGPALDVVLEAVEHLDDAILADASNRYRQSGVALETRAEWIQVQMLAMLRALREHSPTDTPSGSGAQSDTGEAERGS